MTTKEAIEKASLRIDRRDAEVLLRHVFCCDAAALRAHPERELTGHEIAAFMRHVEQRAGRSPMQYLMMRQEFLGMDLQLSRDVLIPRPETEGLVEAVLAWAGEQPAATVRQIADVGTGSGAIALALAMHLPQVTVAALDVSWPVRPVVELNAFRLGLAERVRFQYSDLLERPLRDRVRFDAVVSNPPYVPLGDAPTLAAEVREYEPHLALFAGEDGLAVYRRLIPQAWEALRPGGLLAMEFGFGQREALATLLAGWREVRFLDDYAGIPRVVLALRPD